MRFRSLYQTVFLVITLALLAVLTVAGQNHRLFERAWFNANQWWQTLDERSIDLGAYQVDIEGQVIEGLKDVSALTFDPDRRTLFTVTNRNSELIELSLQGKILRRIPLTGFGDPEAVEYISRGTYVVTDEREQRLIKIHVDDDTQAIDAQETQQLGLAIGLNGNKGFEGLAYDSVGKRLFVAKERDPMVIYEILGFPEQEEGQPHKVHVMQNPERDAGLFVRDLSSLQFDERSGHLLALSDESQLVLEVDVDGRPLSSLSLRKGFQGLGRSVPQAEGIAMDDEGVIYLVSEPNLFYVFRKPD